MMMKRMIYTLLASIFIAVSALAQPGQGPKGKQRNERIEAAKIAFITQRVDLTAEEAQQFWPIYNSYQKEAEDLIRQRAIAKKNGNVNSTVDDELDFKSRMLDLQKRYSMQFFKVLPKQKAVQVFKAEREFRQKLIKELGDRRNKPVAVKS